MEEYQPKGEFEKEVRRLCHEFGGISNAHIHGDRAYTRRDEFYTKTGMPISELGKLTLPEKQQLTWALHNGPAFNAESIEKRMRRLIEESIYFGTTNLLTTVDVTHNTKLKSLEVAKKLKKEYANKIAISIGAYNPSGFKKDQTERFELYEEASQRADFLMGLAEKDRKEGHIGERQHNWYMLNLARELNKPVHFHVGQENRAEDNTLNLLLKDLATFQDLQCRIDPKDFPKVVAVHAISSSCQTEEQFNKTAQKMKEREVELICCPRAAISMLQDGSKNTPTHNSIAKVWDFARKGVKIFGLGVDNLDDIYIPASSPDVYDEAEDLANSLRFYDPNIIAKVLAGRPLDDFDRGKLERILNISS